MADHTRDPGKPKKMYEYKLEHTPAGTTYRRVTTKEGQDYIERLEREKAAAQPQKENFRIGEKGKLLPIFEQHATNKEKDDFER